MMKKLISFITLSTILVIYPQQSLNKSYKAKNIEEIPPTITLAPSEKNRAPKIVSQKKQLVQKKTKSPDIFKPRKNISQKKPSSLIIENNITEEEITYQKHWYKPKPTTCSIMIDNQEVLVVNHDGSCTTKPTVTINAPENNKITAYYIWKIEKFGKVWHTEKKEIVFELPSPHQPLALNFDWETKERLKIKHAKIVSCKECM